jgi:N6-L-threonylcarbamoyladenine synthase
LPYTQPGVVRKALIEADIDVNEVDGVAFTRGPGMSAPLVLIRLCLLSNNCLYQLEGIGGCLSVGSNAAKTLAAALNKPLVGVHHMVC